MAEVTANPFFVKATFTVGTSSYTGHISAYEWVPTTPSTEVTDIGGKVTKFGGSASYVLNITQIQDWTASGLSTYLLAHQTEQATVVISTAQATFTASVTLVAPNIGGEYGAVGGGSLTFPSSTPVRTNAA